MTQGGSVPAQDDLTDSEIVNKILGRFDTDEIDVLRKIFQSLSSKQMPYDKIDKVTFLQFFSLPGLWGERLYSLFAYKNGIEKKQQCIDYTEFLVGLAECCRCSTVEKIRILHRLFDLDSDGTLSFNDLVSVFSNIPNVERYLLNWEDVSVTARVVDLDDPLEIELQSTPKEGIKPLLTPSPPSSTLRYSSDEPHISSLTRDDMLLLDSDDDMKYIDITDDPPKGIKRSLTDQSRGLEYSMEGRNSGGVAPHQINERTVTEIVTEVFQQFAGGVSGGLKFKEFKAWMENGGGLLYLFNQAMHEEFWGLRGSALFRDVKKTSLHQNILGPLKVLKHPPTNTARSLLRCERYAICRGNKPIGFENADDQIADTSLQIPSINSMVTYTKLLTQFTSSDHMFQATGGVRRGEKSLLICPDCDTPLLFCPRCKDPCPSLKVLIPGRKLIIHCKNCLDGESVAFDKCWICKWPLANADFSDRINWSRRGRFEGPMEKIGRTFKRWTQRYYVLTGSMLYYYDASLLRVIKILNLRDCYFLTDVL
eukprot:GHVH01003719.1.p1 GENE.GHVH01003719.1~~GHVH01003719.1.p1  ORF type:complete len:537 (+),score=85.80 GHVH01003719.1:1079-2689(+)